MTFIRVLLIDSTTAQQGPRDASVLIRHRDCRSIFTPTGYHFPYPLAPAIRFELHPTQRRPGPMNQKLAQIAIAAFANSEGSLPSLRLVYKIENW